MTCKIVSNMTYNVFGGTLNLAQSINHDCYRKSSRHNCRCLRLLIVVRLMRCVGRDEFFEGGELLPGTEADISGLTVALHPLFAALSVRRLP